MTLPDYETRPIACPGCAAPLAGHLGTYAEQTPPDPGDVAICIECSQIAIYTRVDGQLGLRAPTHEETDEALQHPDCLKIIAAIRVARESRSPR